MAERPQQAADPDLERALESVGDRLAFPATPDLGPAVRNRLRQRQEDPSWSRRSLFPARWGLVVGLLALVLLAVATLALLPGARTAVAERLGLRGVAITYLPAGPTVTATVPVPSGVTRLGLGERVTLPGAQVRAPYRVLMPALPELGAPDEVYFRELPPGGAVTFIYRPRPGLPPTVETGVAVLLTQFRGTVEPSFFGKGVGPETRLEAVTVNGGRGFWLEGRPHLLFYRDAEGQVRDETIRLAGNTLLWEQGDLTLRLESALSKDEALRIAASVR